MSETCLEDDKGMSLINSGIPQKWPSNVTETPIKNSTATIQEWLRNISVMPQKDIRKASERQQKGIRKASVADIDDTEVIWIALLRHAGKNTGST